MRWKLQSLPYVPLFVLCMTQVVGPNGMLTKLHSLLLCGLLLGKESSAGNTGAATCTTSLPGFKSGHDNHTDLPTGFMLGK